VQPHALPQVTAGAVAPVAQIALHAPSPQVTVAPVHAAASSQWMAHGPLLHSNVTSPQPSVAAQTSEQPWSAGHCTVEVSHESSDVQITSQS
jgi:hypothetical protein